MPGDVLLELDLTNELIHWRGPAPYHFVAVPAELCVPIRLLAPAVTYGWGMVPVEGTIGGTEFTTALIPKDGRYLVPVKDKVRVAEGLRLGDDVRVRVVLRGR